MAGQKQKEFDFYAAEMAVKDIYLGSFSLSPGRHKIRFEGIGRNALSKGNFIGFDSIRLRERWHKKRKLLK
jgi:hypothetical protein